MKKIMRFILILMLTNLMLLSSCRSTGPVPDNSSVVVAYTLTLPDYRRDSLPGKFYLQRSGDGAIIESSLNRDNRYYFFNIKPGNYQPAFALIETMSSAGGVRNYYIFTEISSVQSSLIVNRKNIYGGSIFVRASKYKADEADPFQKSIMKKLSLFSGAPVLDEISGSVYYYSITETTIDISADEKSDFMLYVKDDLGQNTSF